MKVEKYMMKRNRERMEFLKRTNIKERMREEEEMDSKEGNEEKWRKGEKDKINKNTEGRNHTQSDAGENEILFRILRSLYITHCTF